MHKRAIQKVSISLLSISLLTLSCQVKTPRSLEASPKKEESLQSSKADYIRHIEDLESIKRKLEQSIESEKEPTYRKVTSRILEQRNALLKIIEVCQKKAFNPIQARLLPYKVSSESYIIVYWCATGAHTPDFLLFPYTEMYGIQTTPIKLTDVEFSKSGELLNKVETPYLHGFTEYEEASKELLIRVRLTCSPSTTSKVCTETKKYRFENNKFVLKEYLADYGNFQITRPFL